ncbi:MAG: Gfo/Idh/MocA family oxidoreductase [Planctomycetota bacterium]|jgi:predicted dehydrogenase
MSELELEPGPVRLLLVGAGRMGLRHLRGAGEVDGEIVVVDPRPEAEADVERVAAEAELRAGVCCFRSLVDVPLRDRPVDLAILCATAGGRLERFRTVADAGIRRILIEKPLEQSRARVREILKIARDRQLHVQCNHYRRSLDFTGRLREAGGPYHMVVNTGACGLSANGVHWLDFAVHLTRSRMPRMLFGELDETRIASGRGASFRDYGGRALYSFEDGSRLFLSVNANSSAPTAFTVTQPARHCLVDQGRDVAILHERDPASAKPNYLYGQDYAWQELPGVESVELSHLTRRWIASHQGGPATELPTLAEAALAHELLFDLLETSGESKFAIT